MRVLDLIDIIKLGVTYQFYPNAFPEMAADDCATVQLTGGAESNRQISRPSFQVLLRAKNPANAEAKAWEVYSYLNGKRNFVVGDSHIIFCNASQSTPLYIGTDENGRFLYSINFRTLTDTGA